MKKRTKYNICRVFRALFIFAAIFSFLMIMAVAGESDFEGEMKVILHSEMWYTIRLIFGLVGFIISSLLALLANNYVRYFSKPRIYFNF